MLKLIPMETIGVVMFGVQLKSLSKKFKDLSEIFFFIITHCI
jgi:hypothetical protein